MLEPIAIPILMKAIDFLFGEGSKILQERREQRKAQRSPDQDKEQQVKKETDDTSPKIAIRAKEDALNAPIVEKIWCDNTVYIEHLLNLLETYRRNYYLAREKYAKWGDALVPPIVVHEMEDAETRLRETMKELTRIMSKVYGKPVIVKCLDE